MSNGVHDIAWFGLSRHERSRSGPKAVRRRRAFNYSSATILGLACVLAGCKRSAVRGDQAPPGDASARADIFAEMDGGIPLSPREREGRRTWLLWCADNEQFWDEAARTSGGIFELLKTLDSRKRGKRLEEFGLVNQPGFKAATKPDQFGLWLDQGAESPAIDPQIHGRPSGVMGFRLFENPEFVGDAVTKWRALLDPVTGEARGFYENREFGVRDGLVRPYRVGVACGACHVAYNP